MSDRLHDHETIGFRRGCVACAQVEADLALSRADGLRRHPPAEQPRAMIGSVVPTPIHPS